MKKISKSYLPALSSIKVLIKNLNIRQNSSCNFKKKSLKNKSSFRRCSIKKVFLKITQISRENTSVGVSFK